MEAPPIRCEHVNYVHAVWAETAGGPPQGPSDDDYVYAYYSSVNP